MSTQDSVGARRPPHPSDRPAAVYGLDALAGLLRAGYVRPRIAGRRPRFSQMAVEGIELVHVEAERPLPAAVASGRGFIAPLRKPVRV